MHWYSNYRAAVAAGILAAITFTASGALWLRWVDRSPVRVAQRDLQEGRILAATTVIQGYLSENKEDPEALVIWGHCLEAQGRWPDADLVFRRAGALPCEDLERRAKAHEVAGRSLTALDLWLKHLDQCPENNRTLLYLAALLGKDDSGIDANQVIEQLVNRPGTRVDGLALRAMFLTHRRMFPEAAEVFQAVLKEDPDLDNISLDPATLHMHLGETLLRSGQAKPAEEHVLTAMEISGRPNHLAYHLLGEAKRSQGLLEEAVGFWQKSLELNPEFVPSLARLGGHFLRESQTDRALDYLHQAEQLDDRNTQVLYGLSVLYRRLGQTGKADRYRSRFSELSAMDEEDAYLHFYGHGQVESLEAR